MSDYQKVRSADAAAHEARSQMLATIAELRESVRPASLARHAAAAMRERPVAALSAVAVLGGFFIARRRFARSGKNGAAGDATAVASKS